MLQLLEEKWRALIKTCVLYDVYEDMASMEVLWKRLFAHHQKEGETLLQFTYRHLELVIALLEGEVRKTVLPLLKEEWRPFDEISQILERVRNTAVIGLYTRKPLARKRKSKIRLFPASRTIPSKVSN